MADYLREENRRRLHDDFKPSPGGLGKINHIARSYYDLAGASKANTNLIEWLFS